MQELRSGLWTWTARHPAWTPDQEWDPEVRSYALDRRDGVVLFDPIAPPAQLLSGRNVEVALTAEWHRRDSDAVAAPISMPGDPLPEGVEAAPAFFPGDRMLWLPAQRALILGDSMMYGRAIPDAWLETSSRAEYNAALRPLLDLPVELLLPTHGEPISEHAHEHLAHELGA